MRWRRRDLLAAGMAAATGVLTGCTRSLAPPRGRGAARRGHAGPSSPAELVFTPGRTLRAADAPPAYAARIVQAVERYLVPTPDHPLYPSYPGAVVLAAVDGVVTVHAAVGFALRYGTGPVELAPADRVPMRPDSIFDLASITKVFTALLVLRLSERDAVDLAAPVARYLPEFSGGGKGFAGGEGFAGGKGAVTPAMLLAHTGALPDGIDLTRLPSVAARRAQVLATPLVPGQVPGSTFRYSDVGLMVLGLLLERVTGHPLDALVRTELTGPVGLRDTGYTPVDWLGAGDRAARLVATDATGVRGLLRGVVHDENADALGGVAGHAGLFSTAMDLAVVGQLLLNGGEYGGTRVLTEATVRRMLVNVNAGLPAVDPDNRPGRSSHGLGVELDQRWFMGGLTSPVTFGHTGFTGTSLVVDPRRHAVLVLLTNRAHPDWRRATAEQARIATADLLADNSVIP
jgi:CubicO group peptidase (beta-lactamase class C family)